MTEESGPHRRILRLPGIEYFGPLLALAILVIATVLCERWRYGSSNFLKLENILNILRQNSPVCVVAIGMTLVIISGGIDLSVGSLVALAGGIAMWMMKTAAGASGIISGNAQSQGDLPYSALRETMARFLLSRGLGDNELRGFWIALVAALAVGSLAGLISGFLVSRGRLPPFIATLGGFAAYRSIALAIADGGNLESDKTALLAKLGSGGWEIPYIEVRPNTPAVLPYQVGVVALLAVAVSIMLNRMRFGRYLQAIGNNERAAIYSGVKTKSVKTRVYVLMGFVCGPAGLMVAARQHGTISSSQAGQLYELDAIAAVVIGGTRMTGGRGSIFGTVIGVLILGVITNMLSFLGVSVYLQGLVKGAIIVAAVLVQRIGRRSAEN